MTTVKSVRLACGGEITLLVEAPNLFAMSAADQKFIAGLVEIMERVDVAASDGGET